MKTRYYIVRLIGLIVIGFILIYKTYQFKYSSFFFDIIIFGVLSFLGFVLWIWSLYVDLKYYRKIKIKRFLITSVSGVILISSVLILNWQINSIFNKPSLIKGFYDGDFNGTSIDFKFDSTYIFDNSAIGLSNYQHGTYKIVGNSITLDAKNIDNVIKTRHIEIKEKELADSSGFKKVNYLVQIDDVGNVLNDETEFRVIIDNRKK